MAERMNKKPRTSASTLQPVAHSLVISDERHVKASAELIARRGLELARFVHNKLLGVQHNEG